MIEQLHAGGSSSENEVIETLMTTELGVFTPHFCTLYPAISPRSILPATKGFRVHTVDLHTET